MVQDAVNRPVPVLLLARGGMMDGAQQQLAYLVEGMDRSRFAPIIALDRPGPLADRLRGASLEVHLLPMHPWRALGGVCLRQVDGFRLTHLARKRCVRLVHSSDPKRSGYAFMVGRRLGIPSVIHVRGPIGRRNIIKYGLDRASGVIAIADRYVGSLTTGGIAPGRVHCIDDAVDVNRFYPRHADGDAFRAGLGVGHRLIVGLVGRIEPFKRIVEFLQIIACATAPPAADALYLIAGQWGTKEYRAQVRGCVERLGLERRVRFLGRVEEMPAVLGAMDLLVTLSGGSVMFEAMASGKCVLSIRSDPHHSTHVRHDETGWCITSDRPAVSAEAMQRLLGDADLRHRLGRAGRQWAAGHLCPRRMVERTEALYVNLLTQAKNEARARLRGSEGGGHGAAG